jgi:EmrB/QacA subfamily drug resistance transporter
MSLTRAADDRPDAVTEDGSHRWWILAVCITAQLMVIIDTTVVNIALPAAQHDLGFSSADRQWVVTAYSLAFGGLLLLGGRLADLFGRRTMLMTAMVGFAAASALAGAATGFPMLVGARAVQGAFAAMLAPSALSQMSIAFADSRDRGKAFGIYGAVAGGGGAVGLVLGGALTQSIGWRWCLYVNVIVAVVAFVGAATVLPRNGRDRSIAVDWPGTAVIVAGLVSIVYGLSQVSAHGWTSPRTLTLLIVGAALVVLFVGIERRSRHPLLPLRILSDRNRAAADLSIFVSAVGVFGVLLFLSYYLQDVLHLSPVMTGVAYLPQVVVVAGTSTLVTSVLLTRIGPRWLVSSGMLLSALGMVMLAQLGLGSSYVGGVLPGLLISGVGLGLIFGTAPNVATFRAERHDAGVASALVSVGQQVGGSLGTALLNSVAASAAASFLAVHGSSSVSQLGASVHGENVAFAVCAVTFVLGGVLAGLLFRPGRIVFGSNAPAGDAAPLGAL